MIPPRSSTQVTTNHLSGEGNFSVVISFIYAKYTDVQRRLLWSKLEDMNHADVPRVVVGDFNSIKNDRERCGGRPRLMGAIEVIITLLTMMG